MIIYNVTSNIDESIHDEWLNWMRQEHIPQVLGTGKGNMRKLGVKEKKVVGNRTNIDTDEFFSELF